MKFAKDIMTKNPTVVLSSDDLRQTSKLFVDKNISSAPVENPMGEVLGVLTELNLARAFIRNYNVDNPINNKVTNNKDLLVEAISVYDDATIIDVLNEILNAPHHRVLVRNKSGELVGIIAPKDILSILLGEQNKFHDLKNQLEESHHNLKKLDEKLNDLKEVSKKYHSLYNDAPMMMHSVDSKGTILMANKMIHEILGYNEGELVGKSLTDLYSKDMHEEALKGLEKIKQNGSHNHIYTSMVKKDGEQLRVDIVSSALRDNEGQFVATISATQVVDSENLLSALSNTLD